MTKPYFKYIILIFLLFTGFANAQNQDIDARNGWSIAPYGQFHVLVVFAEIDFDSSYKKLDPTAQGGTKDWKAGQLPWWRHVLFDKDPNKPALNGYMTKYFRQASFGKFKVSGDFIDSLISIPISSIRNAKGNVVTREPFANNHYRKAVIREANKIGLKTANGSKYEDFDRWSLSRAGKPKRDTANGKWDMIMVIWRNIHVRNLGDNSGFVTPGNLGKVFGRPTDSYSMFRMSYFVPKTIMRHEFSHMLYGGNNFHTAASGVGSRTFLAPAGGWSNMSNAGRCSPTWNAWDRERMGWNNPEKKYLVSAMCELGRDEVPTLLEYGQEFECGQGKFILRDFATTGDAIKIKLPFIPEGKKQQYLWLENHQRKKGMLDHHKAMNKGLYAFIQVGKDVLTGNGTYGDPNGYTWPLVAEGHYDFGYREEDQTLLLDDFRENKFTGINYLMSHARDLNNDGTIKTAARGKNVESISPTRLEINGKAPEAEYFSFRTLPVFGTRKIAWEPGGQIKIGINENPSATPVMTFFAPGSLPRPHDNRRIYLNGISITITQQDFNGDLHVKIRWDDFKLKKDARWCGDILATEGFAIGSNTTISLDQGLTAQTTKAVQKIDDQNIFAYPTVLEIPSGATVSLGANAILRVKKGSTLLIRKGAILESERKASIVIEDGAFIYVEKGADFKRIGRKVKVLFSEENIGINPLVREKYGELLPFQSPQGRR